MLNIEKYKNEIINVGLDDFAFDGKYIRGCKGIACKGCEFISNGCITCDEKKVDWLCSEYKEPDINWDEDIDWERVPVDTKVRIGNCSFDLIESYFAFYIPNSESRYYVFSGSAKKKDAIGLTYWKYCKLANPEDVEKYRKK